MYRDLADFIERYSVSGPRAYVLAMFGIAVATALRLALTPFLGESSPYSIQVLVVLLSTSLAGYGPGLVSVALAIGLGWSILPPYDQPFSANVMNHFASGFAGVMICLVTATMRSALISAAATRREADFLGREMHHRVKNLFAVVASMATLSARNRPDAHDALMELRSRIQSLADAHDMAMNQSDLISFRDLVNRLVAPYRKPGSAEPRVLIDGEDVDLPHGVTTPMALIFHELATNAVKHGALATPDGYVRLFWRHLDGILEINWQEHGMHKSAEPGPDGFGTVLVDAAVAQMRGTIDRELNGEGLVMRLTVPAAAPKQKQFQTGGAADRQSGWNRCRSSLSAHLASKRYFRRKPAIRDSRS